MNFLISLLSSPSAMMSFAIMAANNSMMLVTSSDDHGASWALAKDITATYSIAKGLTFADGNVWTKL